MLVAIAVTLAVVAGAAFMMGDLWDMLRVSFLGSSNDSPAKTPFDPAKDVPSMAGKVVLITGGGGDLGRQAATELARYGRPARLYIADLPAPDNEKKALADRIVEEAYGADGVQGASPPTQVQFLDLDLSSFDSIRKCASDFTAREKRLDVLFLNAGVLRVPPLVTGEGYEHHFGINYLGHALLARLLIPTLLRTVQDSPSAGNGGNDVRIVVVSSEGHLAAPNGGIDFDKVTTNCSDMHYMRRYGQSKVALIHLAKELARRYLMVKTVAVHPGRILTGMAASLQKESLLNWMTQPIAPFFCVSHSVGVRNHLWAATSSEAVSGTYYEPVGVSGTLSEPAKDESLSKKLWDWTDKALVGVKAL